MPLRHYLPSVAFYRGPLLLLKRDSRNAFTARIIQILQHGCTEPTEMLLGSSLLITGVALLSTGSEYLTPFWAWAAGYILAGLLMIGAMLTRDLAGRMWAGFFCFQLRIWVASEAFNANPPDLQWATAFIGSMAGLWLGLRYYCVLLHIPRLRFAGQDKRANRRRIEDHKIDLVGDLCGPK